MTTVATAPASVALQTCPQDVPSLPAWFAEVTLLAHHLTQRGILDAVCEQVHLARGRAGQYEVIDFLAVLFGYAVSSEPTLATFFERLAPFADPFMALFGREQLPHRSTLSRFLADMDKPCVRALRTLFEHECFSHGFSQEQVGGVSDRGGRRLVIIDIDATRQAARQRALTTCPESPTPRRRLDEVCALGYDFTQARRSRALSQGLLRLDGLYGNASVLTRIQQAGLGFLTRARDYQLLSHPRVQARLVLPCDRELIHPDTGVRREVYEVGYFSDWLEPLFEHELHCRVIVTKRAAPAAGEQGERVTVGKQLGEDIYELFLTSHPARCLQAADVVQLASRIAAPLSRCWPMKMSSKTRVAGARSARMARRAGRSSRNGSGISVWNWAASNSSSRCATRAWWKTPSCQARRRLLSLRFSSMSQSKRKWSRTMARWR